MERLVYKNGRELPSELPSIEGIVQRSSAQNYTVRNTASHLMDLQIDTFDRGNLTIHNADYRIDREERVILYSKKGFEQSHDDGKNFYVHGVQILDKTGKVVFQSTHDTDVEFR